jgi:hypothetical protein
VYANRSFRNHSVVVEVSLPGALFYFQTTVRWETQEYAGDQYHDLPNHVRGGGQQGRVL